MKVHLTTLGCPKNQVDSELMLGMLTEAGFPLAERPEDAECLVVNTCAFIDRAREESIETILELAKLKKQGSCRALIVTGCLTQRYGGDILKEMPEVDGILGTSNLSRIVDLVRQAAGRQDWASSAPPGYLYDATTPRLLTARVPYAYVKIAEGCDMGCTFCAIPQFRGRHRSRPLADIVKEVEGLAARGIQEAILVSQDTLAYGRDLAGNGDIADLLLALGETRMPWIRPMYLHPAHVNDRLVERWARARVVPYLDMPVQHGDDGVLRAPRRDPEADAPPRPLVPGRDSRADGPHDGPVRRSGRDRGRVPEPPRVPGGRAVRSPGRFHLLARGGHAVRRLSRPGRSRGRRRAGGDRAGASGPPRVGAERGPRGHGDRRAGRRPERGPRVRVGRAHRRAGARDRRRRLSARSRSHAGPLRTHPHRRGRGIRAGRRARLISPQRSTA